MLGLQVTLMPVVHCIGLTCALRMCFDIVRRRSLRQESLGLTFFWCVKIAVNLRVKFLSLGGQRDMVEVELYI